MGRVGEEAKWDGVAHRLETTPSGARNVERTRPSAEIPHLYYLFTSVLMDDGQGNVGGTSSECHSGKVPHNLYALPVKLADSSTHLAIVVVPHSVRPKPDDASIHRTFERGVST